MALKKATIVLEGGATRGIFTSGALEKLPYGKGNFFFRCDRCVCRRM